MIGAISRAAAVARGGQAPLPCSQKAAARFPPRGDGWGLT